MPNEDKKMTGLDGLLKGTPMEPTQQWKMVARVNAMRDILVDFLASEMVGQDPTVSVDDHKEVIKEKVQALEEQYLESINKARAERITEKAKDARFRGFRG